MSRYVPLCEWVGDIESALPVAGGEGLQSVANRLPTMPRRGRNRTEVCAEAFVGVCAMAAVVGLTAVAYGVARLSGV